MIHNIFYNSSDKNCFKNYSIIKREDNKLKQYLDECIKKFDDGNNTINVLFLSFSSILAFNQWFNYLYDKDDSLLKGGNYKNINIISMAKYAFKHNQGIENINSWELDETDHICMENNFGNQYGLEKNVEKYLKYLDIFPNNTRLFHEEHFRYQNKTIIEQRLFVKNLIDPGKHYCYDTYNDCIIFFEENSNIRYVYYRA